MCKYRSIKYPLKQDKYATLIQIKIWNVLITNIRIILTICDSNFEIMPVIWIQYICSCYAYLLGDLTITIWPLLVLKIFKSVYYLQIIFAHIWSCYLHNMQAFYFATLPCTTNAHGIAKCMYMHITTLNLHANLTMCTWNCYNQGNWLGNGQES